MSMYSWCRVGQIQNMYSPEKLSYVTSLNLQGSRTCPWLSAGMSTAVPKLQNIDMACSGLQILPSNLGQFSSLQRLNVSWCKLKGMAELIPKLTQLKYLNISCFEGKEEISAALRELNRVHQVEVDDGMLYA